MERTETVRNARQIGEREANLAVGIALTIDVLWIGWYCTTGDYRWMLDTGLWWKFPIAAVFFLRLAQFFARKCAVSIIVDNQYWAFRGITCAWCTLAATCMASGIASFAIDFVLGNAKADAVLFYTLGATLLIMLYSFIPVGIHGFWFGYRIQRFTQNIQ